MLVVVRVLHQDKTPIGSALRPITHLDLRVMVNYQTTSVSLSVKIRLKLD